MPFGADPESKRFDADYRHFPISNDHEKYETRTPEVRRWLQDIFQCLAADMLRYPILFHCTSGKDRTGVVIAVLLLSLGIEREFIIEEYLLSDGDVHRDCCSSCDPPASCRSAAQTWCRRDRRRPPRPAF